MTDTPAHVKMKRIIHLQTELGISAQQAVQVLRIQSAEMATLDHINGDHFLADILEEFARQLRNG